MTAVADPQYERVVQIYRNNMLEFKVSGKAANKTAADQAQIWISKYLASLEANVASDARYITGFVKEYSTTNSDLVAMQARIKKVKSEGPRLQDVYETEKEANKEAVVDLKPYYAKVGAVVGLIALATVVGLF